MFLPTKEEETQPMMKKTAALNILKVLVIGILVVIATRIPFLHKKYEFVNSEYSIEYRTHKAKYKQIIKARDIAFGNLIKDLKNGKLSVTEFTKGYDKVKETSKLALQQYTKTKKQLLTSYQYKGFNAYFFFLLAIGMPIMSLVLCLLFFYILMNPVTTNLKKIVFSIYGSLFLFTASYFLLHALYAEQVYNGDFPENWYINIMRYVPVLVSFTIPILFYHYQTVERKLKSIISKLIVFIMKSEDEYIDSEEKKKKHFDDSFELYEEIVEE